MSRLLSNPVYLGKVRLKGEVYDGAHQPIVDEKTWDAVQHQLSKGKRSGGERPRRVASGALLAGLLRCGVCGAGMTTHSSRSRGRLFRYYTCQTYQKQGAAALSMNLEKCEF